MMANYSLFNSEPRHRQDPFRLPDNQGFEFPSMVAAMPGSPVHPIFSRPGQRGGARGNEACSPAVDVRDCGDHLVFHVEAPGCKVEDLHVNLKQGNLVISGSKQKCTESNSKYLQEECSQGSFSRAFRVPDQTRPEDVTATFHHGVLDVMVKRPQNLSSPIKVNTAPRNTQDIRTSDQGKSQSPIKVNTSASAFNTSQKQEEQNKSAATFNTSQKQEEQSKSRAYKGEAPKKDTGITLDADEFTYKPRNQEHRPSGDSDEAQKKESDKRDSNKKVDTGITLDADEFTNKPRNQEHRPSGDDDEDNKHSRDQKDKKGKEDASSHSSHHHSSPIRVRADSNNSDDGKLKDVKVDLGNTSTTQPINLEIHLQIGQDGSVSQVQKNQGHQGHHTDKKDETGRQSSPIKITTSGSKNADNEISRDNRDPSKVNAKPANTKSSSPITVGNMM